MRKLIASQMSVLALIAVLSISPAHANSVTFQDNSTVWKGLEKIAETNTNPSPDQNGIPDLTGGSLNFTGAKLNSISLDYRFVSQYVNNATWGNTWNTLSPGDWFFDLTPEDHKWDYVIHRSSTSTDLKVGWQLYKVDPAKSNLIHGITPKDLSDFNNKYSSYALSGTSSSTSNTNNRDRHPEFVKNMTGLTAIASVTFDGWDKWNKYNSTTKTWGDLKNIGGTGYGNSLWTIAGDGLDLSGFHGKSMAYAFTMTCANDVIYGEDVKIPNPEPATMLLMGFGAAGVAFMRRRTKPS